MNWETSFLNWAKQPSDAEEEKCENAKRMISKAVQTSRALQELEIKVFAQGSYRNNTNVRLDSDVDICVCCMDYCYTDYNFANHLLDSDVGLMETNYTCRQFKDAIEQALREYFGSRAIIRGNKALNVHENSYRVEADVVPSFEHRRYMVDQNGTPYYISGNEFITDGGERIVNWPDQHYENGVRKNDATGRRFKRIVRILKRLRNQMEEDGILVAKPIPSYLIESLVWNVPNERFGYSTYWENMRWVLAYLFDNTLNIKDCKEWGEINELIYLFHAGQPWTFQQAHNFINAAWEYIGLK
jgi:hypothetical protein